MSAYDLAAQLCVPCKSFIGSLFTLEFFACITMSHLLLLHSASFARWWLFPPCVLAFDQNPESRKRSVSHTEKV